MNRSIFSYKPTNHTSIANLSRYNPEDGSEGVNYRGRIIVIFVLFYLFNSYQVLHAGEDLTAVDWKAKFLKEAPQEWKKLEAAVGTSEVISQVISTSYARPYGVSTNPPRILKGTSRLIFDIRTGGVRSEYKPFPDGDYEFVDGCNNKYYFQLSKPSAQQEFHITKYLILPNNDPNENWVNQAALHYILAAEDLRGAQMPRFINGQAGDLKSATPVHVDGKILVRLDLERVFHNSKMPYPCLVILDPNFHWAIKSFEQKIAIGVIKRTIDYQPEVTDVPFPKHVVEQVIDPLGNILTSISIDFEKPQPSHPNAKEFTLEDFGLESPKTGIEQPQQIAPPATTAPRADLSGPLTGSAANASAIPENQKLPFEISSSTLSICAGALGIFFYVLFLVGRRNNISH